MALGVEVVQVLLIGGVLGGADGGQVVVGVQECAYSVLVGVEDEAERTQLSMMGRLGCLLLGCGSVTMVQRH